ncbi:unnamed protein product [Bursaphelenchus okinawaensis]|uniref:Uncharacterized protein n=1 Tax=Bursaphelenchus okinawaensis TaxID=465554 RepID=A0A811LH35_9BILA|nr:unnamed protein product [Bursaphelenchus okinawaensis]CAG9123317.1 unnamed protein product [Bursaphelenchus okinawaensis]
MDPLFSLSCVLITVSIYTTIFCSKKAKSDENKSKPLSKDQPAGAAADEAKSKGDNAKPAGDDAKPKGDEAKPAQKDVVVKPIEYLSLPCNEKTGLNKSDVNSEGLKTPT